MIGTWMVYQAEAVPWFEWRRDAVDRVGKQLILT